jgi:hypothetical protein
MRRRRAEPVDALAQKADVKGLVSEGISQVKDTVAHGKDRVADVAEGVKQATPESAGAGAQLVAASAKRKPVPFAAAGALAVGVLLGWLLGRRRRLCRQAA